MRTSITCFHKVFVFHKAVVTENVYDTKKQMNIWEYVGKPNHRQMLKQIHR